MKDTDHQKDKTSVHINSRSLNFMTFLLFCLFIKIKIVIKHTYSFSWRLVCFRAYFLVLCCLTIATYEATKAKQLKAKYTKAYQFLTPAVESTAVSQALNSPWANCVNNQMYQNSIPSKTWSRGHLKEVLGTKSHSKSSLCCGFL